MLPVSPQQAVAVLDGAGHDDLEAGDVEEPVLRRLRVLGGEAGACSVRHPHSDRKASLAAGQVAVFGELCETDHCEIRELWPARRR
jgi:hypothetical protein